jgi:hypothetical protein
MTEQNQPYWLFDWLDQQQIADAAKLRQVLDSRSNLLLLRERALAWQSTPSPIKSECNLIAGAGLGIGDGISCASSNCRIKKIDVLYRHAWHYFDYIYLPDAAGDLIRHSEEFTERDIKYLTQLIESSLYLRKIGAEDLTRHYSSYLLEKVELPHLGGDSWEALWEELEDDFLKHPERFDIVNLGQNRYEVLYKDSRLDYWPSAQLNLKSIPKSQRQEAVRVLLASNIVDRHRAAFVSDIHASRQLGGALGSTIWSHEWAMSKLQQNTDDGRIFFQMEFPSLQNIPVSDLISIRLEHRDSFIACRSALRKAIRELSSSKEFDRDDLANQVVRDVVMPEISAITTKLEAARRVLTKKSAIALTIAGVSTWCGVHLGLGMATSLGAGALAALGSGVKDAAYKYSEEKRDLEISDMSFLWKALSCVDR